ncbi:MAG TPA: histidinol dehydrogenase [Micromonosporaceae bacterium]|nr:histidinol dehydrogenase [Micromonosporaceae bacterium]
MLSRIDLRGVPDAADAFRLPRAHIDVASAAESVREVIESVRERGAVAIRAASERFDGVVPRRLRVSAADIAAATAALDPAVREGLALAIAHARRVHGAQRRDDAVTEVVPGGTVTQTWRPVRRVGLYVPGGRAVYPSSVVMNVVPAQIAGVAEIAVASPPQRETGLPHPLVLAACGVLRVDEVYAVGGAQAIAMFAYGTAGDGTAPAGDGTVPGDATAPGGTVPGDYGCPAVDLVTGPGNIFVAAAKRLVRGVVGIDSEAGPTEIAILADDTADPSHVAADLISQAEHDPLAASVLVTTSVRLADAVDAEVADRVAATKHSDRVAEALSGRQSATVVVDHLDIGLALLNAYGAEHLEIQTRDARAVAARVTSAGAVFVGAYSPVSLGDYLAGSNHVLPTGGCARHAGGLTVQTYLKGMQVVEYDADALASLASHVVALADAEDLPAHGEAITARVAPDNGSSAVGERS